MRALYSDSVSAVLVDAAPVEPVTVAPAGTLHAGAGRVHNGTYETTAQRITPPSVV